MSRTPLFAAVKKALARSFHDQGLVVPRSSALTRRRLLRLSAAAAGAAALSPVLDWSAYAKQERPKGPVAIIGGGIAGLTAAYRLQAAGATPIVFEASNRWGGRMFTMYDFYQGMFVELGGELVDTYHEDIHNLAKEVGVEMQDLTVDGGEDLYFLKGQWHTPKDMFDPATQTGAFLPIAKQLAEDQEKLTDKNDEWTKHARKLDKISIKAYLDQFRGKAEDWALDLIDIAYNIEFGLLTEDQSSLAMVDFIGTDLEKPFEMFGESDEKWRIKGGSSVLINALVDRLKDKIEMKQGWSLNALDYKGGQIVMGFDAPGGPQNQSFDAVILTLPFTKLRQCKGLESLRLSPEKLKTIRELGYGMSAKVMFGTKSRVWREPRFRPAGQVERQLLYGYAVPKHMGDEPQSAEPGRRHPYQLPRCDPRHQRREISGRRVPRGPAEDVAKDGRQPRSGRGDLLVLGDVSLHARQLCELQGRPVHDDAGSGGRTGAWGTAAIRRRAYQRRLPRLHEWRRAERQPCLRGAHQGHGAAKKVSAGHAQPAVKV